MLDKLRTTVEHIEKRIEGFKPEIGIVLGTGLGKLVEDIDIKYELMYSNIPNFPISTVEFHAGKLIFGTLNGKNVVAMQGRLHYYEGYSMQQITFPVRVMKFLGVERLLISNACGCLNPDYRKGDLMIIDDHINLLPDNPLRGHNYDTLGSRFPDMSAPYDKAMIKKAEEIAAANNIVAHTGVYVSVPGPNLETRAEYRYLRIIGGDVVGMSTVPEIIVANHMQVPVFAISVITDEGFPDALGKVSLDEIVKVAQEAEPKMTLILKELISSF
ncbi:purine-nucleoside phosphorylase [Solitalea lacus]|uniref:purine-nucleoside phosphorylase n=1 Tax=Solitalea lacus TaxID=2911172 RepID=UPI001ED9F00B|nr:purine-nucleoside phosphorylase [Solitalea lacus]UKJ07054.1 purine-nucleoside phosphorylase [Solitalea lacus]